jgi:hypothetical protein
MRIWFLVLATACTTPSSETCTGALTCSGVDCELTTAENDGTLCPAFEQKCAGYTIISQMGTDTATDRYYDASGTLVAETHFVDVRTTCAGPADFIAPSCETLTVMLAVCGAP